VDGASPSTGEEEFGGVSIHVKLVIGGNDFKSIINDILVEYRGPSFFVGIAEPTKSQVYSWHRATGSRCYVLTLPLLFLIPCCLFMLLPMRLPIPGTALL